MKHQRLARFAQALTVAACFGSSSGSSDCRTHANCAGLEGKCCPTSSGIVLSCCGHSAVKSQLQEEFQQAMSEHVGALVACDAERILKGYTDDALMVFHNHRTGKREVFCKGPECVRSAFTALFNRLRSPVNGMLNAAWIDNTSATFPQMKDMGINFFLGSPNVIFIQWAVADLGVPWATDTIIFDEHFKISTHVVYFDGPSLLDVPAGPQTLTQGPDDAFYQKRLLQHSRAFNECNVDGSFPAIADDYADDAVLTWVNHETGHASVFGKGRTAVLAAWPKLFGRICGDSPDGRHPSHVTVGNQTQLLFGNVAFFDWASPQANGYSYAWAVDTIVYNPAGKIQVHTLYYKGHPTALLNI